MSWPLALLAWTGASLAVGMALADWLQSVKPSAENELIYDPPDQRLVIVERR